MRTWDALLQALGRLVLMGGALGSVAAPAHHHRHFESVNFTSSLGLIYRPPIVFPALQTHAASVFCLHGLARPAQALALLQPERPRILLCTRSRPPRQWAISA